MSSFDDVIMSNFALGSKCVSLFVSSSYGDIKDTFFTGKSVNEYMYTPFANTVHIQYDSCNDDNVYKMCKFIT